MQCVRMGKRGEKWNTYGSVFMQRGWMALMLKKHIKVDQYISLAIGEVTRNFPFLFPVDPVQIVTGSNQFKLLF